jgi:cytochrome c556
MIFQRTHLIAAAVLAIGVGIAGVAIAQQAGKQAIDDRKAAMKSLGAHMAAITKVTKGEDADKAQVVGRAQDIANKARAMAAWFPQGTGPEAGVETRALPAIWTEFDKFRAAATAAASQADKLSDVAKGGDLKAMTDQFAEVGKACGGCHTPFRKPAS